MTTDTLDFPEIMDPPAAAAAAAPTANVPAVVTLREAALAKITKTEQDLRALATRYDKVAFDFTTPKGRKAATEARSELRDARLTVQRAHTETKDELNDLKRDIKDKADELIAIVQPVENHVDGQIKAHEARVAEEKRIAAEKEQARKKVHEDNIATLRSYVARAAGQPSAALRKGIDVLAALVIDPTAWEEYAEAAVLARDETLASLQQMFDTTFAAEQAAIEAERVRKENEARQQVIDALAKVQATVSECFGASSEFIADRRHALVAQANADPAPEVAQALTLAIGQLDFLCQAAVKLEQDRASAPAPVEPPAAAAAPTPAPAPAAAPVAPPARRVAPAARAAQPAPAPAPVAEPAPAPAPAARAMPEDLQADLPLPEGDKSLEEQLADARAALADACDLLDEVIKNPVKPAYLDDYLGKVNDIRSFGGIA